MNKEISEEIKISCSKKVLFSRARLLQRNGFYGLLLMHMKFSLSYECEKATVNGEYLIFNPEFLMKLSDTETEYVLMHLVTHVALQHYSRADGLEKKKFFEACDIVVNSNILYSNNMDTNSIRVDSEGGTQPHLAPDGTEGYLHSVYDIYAMLLTKSMNESGENEDARKGDEGSAKESNDPVDADNKTENKDSDNGDSTHNISNSTGWDDHNNGNSAPQDSECNEDEWKYRILEAMEKTEKRNSIMKSEGSKTCGKMPEFFERVLMELRKPSIDWRTVLNEFIQEEVMDYSFSPPDRRYDDSPFFLPDFNEKEDRVKDILFMVDTSGSMSDKVISSCYYEIKSAIDQFNGKLEGWLGFFDAKVIKPQAFSDEDELSIIRPKGGGGTSFSCIFEYVNDHIDEFEPASIVILTDGYAPFPDESISNNIPVLWIICESDIVPPWGKCVSIMK